MDFIELFSLFLILIVPGIISAIIFGFIACLRREPTVATTLIFDLWTFIIMILKLLKLQRDTDLSITHSFHSRTE